MQAIHCNSFPVMVSSLPALSTQSYLGYVDMSSSDNGRMSDTRLLFAQTLWAK
jgi:hypothetical protein